MSQISAIFQTITQSDMRALLMFVICGYHIQCNLLTICVCFVDLEYLKIYFEEILILTEEIVF